MSTDQFSLRLSTSESENERNDDRNCIQELPKRSSSSIGNHGTAEDSETDDIQVIRLEGSIHNKFPIKEINIERRVSASGLDCSLKIGFRGLSYSPETNGKSSNSNNNKVLSDSSSALLSDSSVEILCFENSADCNRRLDLSKAALSKKKSAFKRNHVSVRSPRPNKATLPSLEEKSPFKRNRHVPVGCIRSTKKRYSREIEYSSEDSLSSGSIEIIRCKRLRKKRKIVNEVDSFSSSSSGFSSDSVGQKPQKKRIRIRYSSDSSSYEEGRKIIESESFIDSEDNSEVSSVASSCSISNLSAEGNYLPATTCNETRRNRPRVSQVSPLKTKEENIKKLKTHFRRIGINITLSRNQEFFNDCKDHVYEVLKWFKQIKNINELVDPLQYKTELEVYLDFLELNTRDIISCNKRLTRSQTADRRWMHYLKYGERRKWPCYN